MNKKGTLLQATLVLSAGIDRATGCNNNAIFSRGVSREKIEEAAVPPSSSSFLPR